MKRPQDELNFVINELLEGIPEREILGVRNMFGKIHNTIKETERYMGIVDSLREKILQTVKSHMMITMQSLFMSAKRDGNFQQEILASKLQEDLQNFLEDIVSKELGEILSDYQYQSSGKIYVTVSGEYKRKKTVLEYPIQYMEKVQRAPKGLIENFSAIIFDTKYYDTHTVKKTGRREVETGDNFNELFNENWSLMEGQLDNIVKGQIEYMKKEYFSEILNVLKTILKELEFTEKQLKEVQMNGGNV